MKKQADLEPIPENVMKEEAVEEEVQEKTIAKTDDSAPPMGKMDADNSTGNNFFLIG